MSLFTQFRAGEDFGSFPAAYARVIESFIFSDVKTWRTEIKGTLHTD